MDTCSRHAIGFQIIFHPAGCDRAQKEFVAGRGFDTFQCASVRLVMFCVSIISDGFHSVFVLLECRFDILLLMGLATVDIKN